MLQYLFRRMAIAAFFTFFVFLTCYSQYVRPTTVVPGSTQDKNFDNADRIHREATQKPVNTNSTYRPVNNTKTNNSSSSTNTNNTPSVSLSKPTTVKEPDYYQREAGSCICNATPLSEVKFARTDYNSTNVINDIEKGILLNSRAGNDYIVAVPRDNGWNTPRGYDVFYVNYSAFNTSGKINTGKKAFYLYPDEVTPFYNNLYINQELQDLERRVMEKVAPFFKQGARVQFNVNTGSGTTRLTGWRMYINLRDSVFIAVPDPKAVNKGNIYLLNLAGNYYNETAVPFMPYEVPMKSASDYELIGDFVNNKFSLQTIAKKRDRERIDAEITARIKPIYTANRTFRTTSETAAPYTLLKYVSSVMTVDSGYKLNFVSKDSFLIAHYDAGSGSPSTWSVLLFRYENGADKSLEYTFPRIDTVITNIESVSNPVPAKNGKVQPPQTDFLKKLEESAIQVVHDRVKNLNVKNFNFIGTTYTCPGVDEYLEYHFGIITLPRGVDYMGVFSVDAKNNIYCAPWQTKVPGVIFSNGKITSVGSVHSWDNGGLGLNLTDSGVFSINQDRFVFGKWKNSTKIRVGPDIIAKDGFFSFSMGTSMPGKCMVYKNDDTQILGDCNDDLLEGLCTVWTPDGKCYEALFSKGEPVEDKGASQHRKKSAEADKIFKKIYLNGDVYVGALANGLKQGYGILKLATGNTYRGYFWDDRERWPGYWTLPDGTQSIGDNFVYTNGDVYYGQFYSGKRQGPGCLVLTNGNVQFGIFKENDLPDGMMAFKNGDLARGVIKNGKLEGDVLYIDKAKRTVTQQKFQNGIRVGQ